jgi:hypothetical protein
MSDLDQQKGRDGSRADAGRGAREGFGDDGGARVGRPDSGRADERATSDSSMARLAHNAGGPDAVEGSILDDETRRAQASLGGRSELRADGSSMTGDNGTLDRSQRAQSGTPERGSGAGAEGAQGVHSRKAEEAAPGTDDRAGSEPLEGRGREHKGSYGGEGGVPRTSSDQRENPKDPKIQ